MKQNEDNNGNVINLPVRTVSEVPVDKVLGNAIQADLEIAVVMGFKDGEFYGASSTADGGAVLFLIELLKRELMDSSDYMRNVP